MFLWEETGKCTRGTHRGKGPGTWGKTCGDNVGKGQLPAETGDPPQADKDLLYGATEGSRRTSQGLNRTREIRPSGILGGLAETWAMVELGTRRTYRKGA